jgi:hypothetical protein
MLITAAGALAQLIETALPGQPPGQPPVRVGGLGTLPQLGAHVAMG